MSKNYELNTLEDLFSLDTDAFERCISDLRNVQLAYSAVVDIHNAIGSDKPELSLPLVWIDDGKNDLTVELSAKIEE